MTERIKVGGMPPPNESRRLVDWDAVAEALREHPHEAVLLPQFTSTESAMSVLATVNRPEGTVRALRELGGKVIAQMRNSKGLVGRRRRGDVWLTWHPEE